MNYTRGLETVAFRVRVFAGAHNINVGCLSVVEAMEVPVEAVRVLINAVRVAIEIAGEP
jgi:hypothetical protein